MSKSQSCLECPEIHFGFWIIEINEILKIGKKNLNVHEQTDGHHSDQLSRSALQTARLKISSKPNNG